MAPTNDRPQSVARQPIWDSFSYAAAGQANVLLFATGKGAGATAFGGGGVKTLRDSNMPPNAILAPGGHQSVDSLALIGWSTSATQAADLALALLAGVIEIRVAGIKWLELPICMLTAGCGVEGFAATTVAATSLQAAHNGAAVPQAVFSTKDVKIEIDGGQTIEALLTWPNGVQAVTTAFPFTLALNGIQTRSH